ncbi:autoinducer binding domain-containing protein [Pseudomonas sp. LS1212]|uniref:autoinducer binding domain-containing protein n=1 Tax=Pseudomonas sp. LS1212 TaxID=2972478 RepID=UPI00215CF7E4|nr:autoinducer binding domain-containing protein [Pseudomonas sp. LS1212]UVJ42374.1 autoinducer binding domain-containing protein [Pseudomonas sp. LS1212]
MRTITSSRKKLAERTYKGGLSMDAEFPVWEKFVQGELSRLNAGGESFGVFGNIARKLDFDYFAIEVFKVIPYMRPEIYVIGNYPEKWVRCYRASNYAVMDSRVQHCKISNEVFVWASDIFLKDPRLWGCSSECGLSFGLTFPSIRLREFSGYISLARRENDVSQCECECLQPKIKLLAREIIEKVSLGFMLQSTDLEFSGREKEVMRWTADGKTSEEISIILGVTVDAINFHQKNIQEKIGANNRVQAVAYAIAQGYI